LSKIKKITYKIFTNGPANFKPEKEFIMNFIAKRSIFKNAALLLILCVSAVIITQTGCDDGGGITVPSGATQLSVSMKSLDNTQSNIVITEAKALISSIDFEIENGGGKNQRIQTGEFVMNLGLDGNLKQVISGYIIRDNVTKIKMQIHKTEESETPPDAEFKDGTAENLRYSFIIKGTFNGSNFVYKSKKNALVIINFSKTLNINLEQMNVTVLFDKTKWFFNGSTNVNPADVQNENLIDNNLQSSFKQVFIDNNSDGQPDN
jgi:hypothetical protein